MIVRFDPPTCCACATWSVLKRPANRQQTCVHSVFIIASSALCLQCTMSPATVCHVTPVASCHVTLQLLLASALGALPYYTFHSLPHVLMCCEVPLVALQHDGALHCCIQVVHRLACYRGRFLDSQHSNTKQKVAMYCYAVVIVLCHKQ